VRIYSSIKRLIDILLALLLLPAFSICTLIVGFAIKLEDRGPVFFFSKRLGMNGRVFNMLKFRSMIVNAQDIRNDDGSSFSSKYDPRVTRVGRALRSSSIDELPQIINVLKGDMSFIGPRPDLPGALEIYTGSQLRKLDVRPGITGLSQAFFRNSINRNEKFAHDTYYVDNMSFCMDVKIVFVTLKNVFLRKNIYATSEDAGETGR
jgi:undecaprenyl phosphate N,N'-diacetylbacillosamine 1-phosphate transferase